MIVTCNACQARFRIADEKIGARGVKVRCSKCQSVFIARRSEAATAGDASPARPPPLPPAASPGHTLELDLAAPADRGPARAAADPFAPAIDPFALAPASPDPFAQAQVATAFPSASLADPFVAAVTRAPSGAPAEQRTPSRPSLALTDLSDLAGAEETVAPAAPPLPSLAASRVPALGADLSLALDERTPTPAPAPVAPADPFGAGPSDAGFDLSGFAPDAFDPSAFDPSGLGAPFGRADEVALDVDGAAAARPAPPPPAPAPAANAAPPRRPAPPRPADAQALPPRTRESRLRAVAVNSVSLALLLTATVGLLVVWHGEGRVDARAFQPRTWVAAFGRPLDAGDAPVVAARVSNGLYATSRGRSLLFVRGVVESRAASPLGPVRVKVEVVRGERVVAEAEQLAGAIATPEELFGVNEPEDALRLAAALAPRAPKEVRPGETLPFLVTFLDPPPDLRSVAFRVVPMASRAR